MLVLLEAGQCSSQMQKISHQKLSIVAKTLTVTMRHMRSTAGSALGQCSSGVATLHVKILAGLRIIINQSLDLTHL